MKRIKRSSWLVRTVCAVMVAALLAGGLGPGFVVTTSARPGATPRLIRSFANTAPIAITAFQQSTPSAILVSGFAKEVADVEVTLSSFTHGSPGSVDVLLVGPGGQSTLLVSDIGSSANAVTLTLDDGAAGQVPSSGPLASGTFQPTNFGTATDAFAPPAPAKPSNAKLGVFSSTDPNGVWTLYVKNDTNATGALNGGWSLEITTANGVPNASPDRFEAQAGKALSEPPFGVLANDFDPDNDNLTAILAGKPRKARSNCGPMARSPTVPTRRPKAPIASPTWSRTPPV